MNDIKIQKAASRRTSVIVLLTSLVIVFLLGFRNSPEPSFSGLVLVEETPGGSLSIRGEYSEIPPTCKFATSSIELIVDNSDYFSDSYTFAQEEFLEILKWGAFLCDFTTLSQVIDEDFEKWYWG